MDQLIGKPTNRTTSYDELAAECEHVSDKLNNLLTGIQIKAGLLLGQASILQVVRKWHPPLSE